MVRPPFDDFEQATPADPDGSTALNFILYASVMQGIQAIEMTVALLRMTATTTPKTVSGKAYQRQARKSMATIRHVNQKVSATDNVKELKGKIPEELHSELRDFIKRRNFFAHRFFNERMETTGDRSGKFVEGTAMDLLKTSHEFTALLDRLQAHERSIRATWAPVPEPPPEVKQWIDDVTQLLVRGRIRPEVLEEVKQWIDDVTQLLVRGRIRPEVLEEVKKRAAAKAAAEQGADPQQTDQTDQS